MGKMGALLRQNKAKNTTYTFTREQLEQHDATVRHQMRERLAQEFSKQWDDKWKAHEDELWSAVRKEWEERESQFYSTDREQDIYLMLQYTLSVGVSVLCNKFGWHKEKPDHYDARLNINKYADYVADEIASICGSELKDIRTYAENVYKDCGVKFKFTQED